jgi:hypothetical protein
MCDLMEIVGKFKIFYEANCEIMGKSILLSRFKLRFIFLKS